MKQLQDRLRTELEDFEITLQDQQLERLLEFSRLLLVENRVQNLTRITDPLEVITRHLVDSLVALKWLPDPMDSGRIIDIGTGGGFPGMPLALALPEHQVLLVDSESKKVEFLARAAKELKVFNISTLHSRAEDLGQNPSYRESADLAVSRSVANLAVLLEYTLPLTKVGGAFFAYKGADIESEMAEAKAALDILGGQLAGIHKYTLANGDTHQIIEVAKVKRTPGKFPRRPGIPQKRPLS